MNGKILFRFLTSDTSHNRARNLRVLLGIAITFAVIITVLCSMEYLAGGQMEIIKSVRSFPLTVESQDKTELEELLVKYEKYHPFIYMEGAGYLVGEGERRAVQVRYIDASYGGDVRTGGNPLDSGGVILPAKSWRSYGRSLSLTRLEKGKVVNVAPRSIALTLSDIYATRLGEFDSNYIFMSLEDAPAFGVYTLAFMTEEKDEARLKSLIENEGYTVITWQEREGSLYGALQLEHVIMTVLLSALYVIFIFQIIQNASLLSRAKKSELVTLGLMGVKKRSLYLIFSLMGVVITALSFALGFLLSFLFINLAPYILPSLSGVTSNLRLEMIAPFIVIALFSALSYLLSCMSEFKTENVREVVNSV